MRVLHVITNMNSGDGGPARALDGLAVAQRELGLQVHVACGYYPFAPPDLLTDMASRGVPSTTIGPLKRWKGYRWDLGRRLDPHVREADIVHIHCLWERIQHVAAALARKHRKPYVFTLHGMLDPYSLSLNRLGKRAYLALFLRRDLDRAAAIHYTAELERDKVKPLRLRTAGIVEPNGLDLDEFDPLPPAGAFRARYPALGDRPIVLFLSRVHPKKGVDLLIDAFAQADAPDAMLVIAGPCPPEYERQLQQQVAERGLTERVLFTGMLRGGERINALRDADLFVLPSHQENFGIVVVEALAAGTPVLISDHIDIWPWVAEHDVGRVFPLRVPDIAAAINQALGDPTWRRDASRRAARFAASQYDWRQIAARWCGHYERLLGRDSAEP